MKTYLTTTISTRGDAQKFFKALDAVGKLFHPEDSPETVISVITGMPLFSMEESIYLTRRLQEVYTVDADPCAYIIENILNNNNNSTGA